MMEFTLKSKKAIHIFALFSPIFLFANVSISNGNNSVIKGIESEKKINVDKIVLIGQNLPEPNWEKVTENKILFKFKDTSLKIPAKIGRNGNFLKTVRSSIHKGNEAWVVFDIDKIKNIEVKKVEKGIEVNLEGNTVAGVENKKEKDTSPNLEAKQNISRLTDVSIKPDVKGLRIVLTSDSAVKYTMRKLQRPDKLVIRFFNTKLEIKNSDNYKKEYSKDGLLNFEIRQLPPQFSPFTEAIFTFSPGSKMQIDRDLNQVVIEIEPGVTENIVINDKKGNLNQEVSLDIEGADLSLVVKTLASEANFDVDIIGAFQGTVNQKFEKLPFKTALAMLLSPGGYDYDIQGNTLRIGTSAELKNSKSLMQQMTELVSPSGGMTPTQFDNFVRTILKPTNATVTVIDENRNSLILKGTYSDIQEYKRAIKDLKLDENSGDDRITRVVKLNYADATQMSGILKNYLTPSGNITVRGSDAISGQDYNQLVIRETSTNMGVLLELIKEIDVKAPQVLIESNIIEINDQNDLNLGIIWSANKSTGDPTISSSFASGGPVGSAAFTLGTIKSGMNISATLQALETKKKGKVISRPRIATASGRLATINTVENVIVSSTTQTISNGTVTNVTTFTTLPLPISLSVTPYITDDGRITTNILATITSQSGPAIGGAPPPTNTQTATTRITTKNGETIVIGGLVRELVQDTVNGIPVLSSLPIIGALFQSHEKTSRKVELVIFITPTILED